MPVTIESAQILYAMPLRNAKLALAASMIGANGTVSLYNSIYSPTDPSAPIDGTLLAVFQCSAVFAGEPANALLTVNPITSSAGLPAAGEGTPATIGRISSSDGTGWIDFTVGDPNSTAAMRISPDNNIKDGVAINILEMSFYANG